MDNEIIVYWAPSAYSHLQGTFALLNLKPKPLINYMVKNKKNDSSAENLYQSCTAFREEFSNTFYIEYPVTTKVYFDENGKVIRNDEVSDWYLDRRSSFENANAVDLDVGVIFFCEEPLKMKITPPYFHKTKTSETAFFTAGAYDISSWFRAIIFTHQTFPNFNYMETVSGEPAMYVSFETDKKIIFKQFVLTDSLFKYGKNCVDFKKIKPFLSFKEMYERFNSGNLNKIILKEIKENLVE